MEVGTTPIRWKFLNENGQKDKAAQEAAAEARKERVSRCNVTRLDFGSDGQVSKKSCDSSTSLLEALKDDDVGESSEEKRELRLFVVEDLSRDVIEALGSKLDIEPAFFREHILDFAWYNIRDREQDPPKLRSMARKERWVQLR